MQFLKIFCDFVPRRKSVSGRGARLSKAGAKKPGNVLLSTFPVLVRETGLEPVRHGHTPLKRACLPVPALSHFLLPDYYSGNKDVCQHRKEIMAGKFFSCRLSAGAGAGK
jgi:hypothetical protein